MNIFKFRVIIDTEEDVFRDIEIATDADFKSLHKNILKAFEWKEGEMASFYLIYPLLHLSINQSA